MRRVKAVAKEEYLHLNLAMESCEKNDILTDIISRQRGEVMNLLLNEFDVKSYENWIRQESKEEGRALGKAEFILELLGEVGEVPDALRDLIMEQRNAEQQKVWLKAASRARSIEEFERAVGLVGSEN